MNPSKKHFVKICGISKPADAQLAIKLGADALGFISYEKSPRFQTPQQVKAICKQLPHHIKKVLVCVNLPLDKIQDYIKAGITTIQLHGEETRQYEKKITLPLWRAVRLQKEQQIKQYNATNYEMFIIDSFSKQYGGSGKKANWLLARQFIAYHKATASLIAGGISHKNIKQALTTTKANGVDLSSSIEDAPAIKNHQKMQAIFKTINDL